ncbi:MAG: metallophosphoesterase family protein [Mycobacterium leprae]
MTRAGRCLSSAVRIGIAAAVVSLVAAATADGRAVDGGATRAAAATTVPTVVAAGDISPRRLENQRATANLVLRLAPTRVLTLGDQQYDAGRLADYQAYYGPTWGRFKAITSPVPGNHEYDTLGAAGYFDYFGAAAGTPGQGYYSFDLGGWHLVALNSNIAYDPGSEQEIWLRRDLAETSKRCVLAYWRHPRFSSGSTYGDDSRLAPFWTDLSAVRADIVLNGHEHNYERFGPQTPDAVGDPRGIREFVVGTGGAGLYPFGPPTANSQQRITGQHGVLHVTLNPTSYQWKFVAVDGTVLDRGGPVACH